MIEGHLPRSALRSGEGAFPPAAEGGAAADPHPARLPAERQGRPVRPARQRRTRGARSRSPRSWRRWSAGSAHAFVATDLLWLDGQSLLDVPLLERKRLLETVLEESYLVRVTPFVRPSAILTLVTWGIARLRRSCATARANSRYLPGRENPDWAVGRRRPRRPGRRDRDDAPVRSAARRSADGSRRPALAGSRRAVVGWARARDDADARHPGRDRPPRPRRHHGRHPELQERGHDRLRGPRGACRAGPVLPGPQARARQLGRRQPRRHPARGHRDRAARTTSSRSSSSGPRTASTGSRSPTPRSTASAARARPCGRSSRSPPRSRSRRWSSSTATCAASSPSGSSSSPGRSSRAATTSSPRCTPATSTTARSPTPSPTR